MSPYFILLIINPTVSHSSLPSPLPSKITVLPFPNVFNESLFQETKVSEFESSNNLYRNEPFTRTVS